MADKLFEGQYFYQDVCDIEDLKVLSTTLHPDDKQELIAVTAWDGRSPLFDVLQRCVDNSMKTYVIRCMATDIPMAIGGYTSAGNCWFLSSESLMELTVNERQEFHCALMKNLLDTLKLFPMLCNAAWSKNTQHLRLIQSCGGRIGHEGYAPNGEGFVCFSFHREDYPQLRNM